jgi:sec-independent protein translocase protein TatC
MTEEPNEEELEDVEMPFWDHVKELGYRIKRIAIALIVAVLVMMIVPARPSDLWDALMGGLEYKPLIAAILDKMKEDMLPPDTILIGGTIEDPITLYFEISMVFALIIASPVIAYEIYAFIAPGLYSHEKRFLKRFVFGFTVMFIIGVVYSYYFIMPITFRILLLFTDIIGAEKIFSVRNFYNMIFLGLVSVGLFFTLPVFLVLAIKFGILDTDTLINYKRYIYVAVIAVTAILTPDPTPVTMLLLSMPFILLYELSIFLGKRVEPLE